MPIFDSHFHLFEPGLPIQENQGYLPPKYTCEEYLKTAKEYGITAGALVSSSFQSHSDESLIKNLTKLPPGFVGVATVDSSVTDREITHLHQSGVRAIRFNLRRLNIQSSHQLMDLALRVHSLHEWHSELYVESTQLAKIRPLLYELPSFSIDHLGMTTEGIPEILNLVEQGARIKASGFGRLNFNKIKLSQLLTEIHAINPHALMFGSDLPAVRSSRKLEKSDIELIHSLFNEKNASMILYTNALQFYGVKI
jgi:predicted TIM-barrel fold metal-dependent hydrolase